MSEVTSPILTDATGQEIVSKLNTLLTKMDNLAAAFQPNASGIVYSNTTSGLTGDDVQEAIDEMAADVSEINQSLCDFKTFTEIGVLSSGHTTLTINKNTYKALFLYETSGSNTLYTNFVPVASQYALVNNGQTFKIKDSAGETFNFTVAVSGNNVTFTYSSSSNPNAVMRFLGYK